MATSDVFALATAVAHRTGRIPLTLGPLAFAVRDPMTIARGVASVADLTGHRVDVAIGAAGVDEVVVVPASVDADPGGERTQAASARTGRRVHGGGLVGEARPQAARTPGTPRRAALTGEWPGRCRRR